MRRGLLCADQREVRVSLTLDKAVQSLFLEVQSFRPIGILDLI